MTQLSSPKQSVGPTLRMARVRDPYRALGLFVSYLMSKPAYAHVRFNAWARVLAGQINRGHYVLVIEDPDRVVGALGWAFANEAGGQAWMQGRQNATGDPNQGDCIIFNVWAADKPEANALLLDAARHAMRGKQQLFFHRMYPDGRARPVQLSVNRFVERHLARRNRTPPA